MTSDLTTGLTTAAPVADVVRDLVAVSLDEAALEAARLRVVDTLFATAVGRRTEQGRRSAAVADALHGSRSVASRAFRLASACRMTEIDDIDLVSCTTPGAIVVPTVLAVLGSLEANAPTRTSTTVDIADVVARGYEVAVGLGEAMSGPRRLASGVWPSLAVAAVAAAAVTVLLLDGDPDELDRAVVLASQQTVEGNPRGTAREHLFGAAVVTGIGSALAVRRGFAVSGSRGAGPLSRLLDTAVAPGPRPRVLRPAVKRFCSARQAMTSVVALRQLLDRTGPVAGSLERIEVEVPHEYAVMLDKPQVHTRRDSISSVAYQLALALCRPAGLLDVARPDLHVEELATVMQMVHVRGSDDLSALYPRAWPGRVRLRADGLWMESTAERIPDEDDLSVAALIAKMTDFAAVAPELADPVSALTRLISAPLVPDRLFDLFDVVEGQPPSPQFRAVPRKGVTS